MCGRMKNLLHKILCWGHEGSGNKFKRQEGKIQYFTEISPLPACKDRKKALIKRELSELSFRSWVSVRLWQIEVTLAISYPSNWLCWRRELQELSSSSILFSLLYACLRLFLCPTTMAHLECTWICAIEAVWLNRAAFYCWRTVWSWNACWQLLLFLWFQASQYRQDKK